MAGKNAIGVPKNHSNSRKKPKTPFISAFFLRFLHVLKNSISIFPNHAELDFKKMRNCTGCPRSKKLKPLFLRSRQLPQNFSTELWQSYKIHAKLKLPTSNDARHRTSSDWDSPRIYHIDQTPPSIPPTTTIFPLKSNLNNSSLLRHNCQITRLFL